MHTATATQHFYKVVKDSHLRRWSLQQIILGRLDRSIYILIPHHLQNVRPETLKSFEEEIIRGNISRYKISKNSYRMSVPEEIRPTVGKCDLTKLKSSCVARLIKTQ